MRRRWHFVATGIMKAKDVARAEEAIRYIGLTLILIACTTTTKMHIIMHTVTETLYLYHHV